MIPRAKILTEVTVPSGGWAWAMDISNGVAYDTPLSGSIAAGTYFIAGDYQDDDLIYALMASVQTAIDTALPGASSKYFTPYIDATTHKVVFAWPGSGMSSAGSKEVQMALASWDSDLLAAIGFPASGTIQLTTDDTPYYFATHHHAYGFYCDETGQSILLKPNDLETVTTLQATTLAGQVKSQYFGSRFENELRLQFLERYEQTRTKVFSGGSGYGVEPAWPYNWNEPLECWFQEAKLGRRFRVYENGRVYSADAADRGTNTNATTTSLVDSGKNWDVDPDRWAGKILHVPAFQTGVFDYPQSFHVVSNTADTIVVANAPTAGYPAGFKVNGEPSGITQKSYELYDHSYGTYVLDIKKMGSFDPKPQNRATDRWGLTIPLKRYVA